MLPVHRQPDIMASLCRGGPVSTSSRLGKQDCKAEEAGMLLGPNVSAEDLN